MKEASEKNLPLKNMSRRKFLRGVTSAGVLAGLAVPLAGCSPSQSSTSSTASTSVSPKFYTKPETSSMEEMLDKYQITELIYFERYCRDHALWEEEKKCFAEDSTVDISWYHGSGHGFVDASSKLPTKGPHRLYNTVVWLNKDRTKGAAVMNVCIQIRKAIDGIELDLSSYARLCFTVKKVNGKWLINSFDAIYEEDSLVPVTPSGMTASGPNVRDSYKNLTRVMSGVIPGGIPGDLPGDDKPETYAALMAKLHAWVD